MPQHRLEVLLEGLAIETGGIGILEEAGGRRDRARMADTDRQVLTPDGHLEASHYPRDRLQRRPVVALGRRHALARDEAGTLVHDDAFDLGAAQIDADAHRYGRSTHTAAASTALPISGRCGKVRGAHTPRR